MATARAATSLGVLHRLHADRLAICAESAWPSLVIRCRDRPCGSVAELESDLRSVYRKHSAEPLTHPTTALEAGSAYPMHQFTTTIRTDADPLGLTHSRLYPRVIHHANHVVGIPTPATASNAMDAMINQLVNPRAENADATVKGWRAGSGFRRIWRRSRGWWRR